MKKVEEGFHNALAIVQILQCKDKNMIIEQACV